MTAKTFVSYAREDSDFVLRLAGDLKAQGVPIWLDKWDIAPGAKCTAMFRPQDMTIGEPGAHSGDGPLFSGRIQHREFLGSFIRYAVEVGDNVILVDDTHQAGRPVFEVGDSVAMRLDAEQVRVLTD